PVQVGVQLAAGAMNPGIVPGLLEDPFPQRIDHGVGRAAAVTAEQVDPDLGAPAQAQQAPEVLVRIVAAGYQAENAGHDG
ncbi:hypothetical protein DF186_23480, partial [Enterococcus hirae]